MSVAISLASALAQVTDPNSFNNYLLLGYGLMWLISLVYMLSLANRQRNIQQDIEFMKQILQEDEEHRDK